MGWACGDDAQGQVLSVGMIISHLRNVVFRFVQHYAITAGKQILKLKKDPGPQDDLRWGRLYFIQADNDEGK